MHINIGPTISYLMASEREIFFRFTCCKLKDNTDSLDCSILQSNLNKSVAYYKDNTALLVVRPSFILPS